jgi:peptidyl-prolyl cis-trans isomerase B (cyclophilin B)
MADTKTKKFDFTSLNTLAVVSIASALTSIGAVAAIITGHVALTQIKKSGESGRGLALAGTIIGYVTIALWVLGSIALAVAGAYLRGKFGMDDMGMHRMGWMD